MLLTCEWIATNCTVVYEKVQKSSNRMRGASTLSFTHSQVCQATWDPWSDIRRRFYGVSLVTETRNQTNDTPWQIEEWASCDFKLMRRDEGVHSSREIRRYQPCLSDYFSSKGKKSWRWSLLSTPFSNSFFCILAKSNQHLFFPYPLWIVPFPTELHGTAARFVYHWGRQLKVSNC